MRRIWRGLVLAAVVVLAAGGCKTLTANTDTASALERAGFTSVSVSNSISSSSSRVSVKASSDQPDGRIEAAMVVWDNFPLRFDRLDLNIDGNTASYSHGDLQSMFGPRPGNLDAHTLSGETIRLGVAVLAGIAVVGILVLVLVLVLVRRSRRRARPPSWAGYGPPPGWGGYGAAPPPSGPPPSGPQPGWGPPPPQQPGWGAPPPGWGAPPPAHPAPAPTQGPPADAPTTEIPPTGWTIPPSGWTVPPPKPTPPPRRPVAEKPDDDSGD